MIWASSKPGKDRNFDAEIMPYISSCNIACGFHSGSPQLMEQTILAAIQHRVKIGAHPSYNDRENFGRVSVEVDRAVLLAEIRYQVSALKGMVESLGGKLWHVKPHGALYNDMAKDLELAMDVVGVVNSIDPELKVVGLAHSKVLEACLKEGTVMVREGFADRRYEAVDRLRSREFADAVLHEPEAVLEQIDGFLRGEVVLVGGGVVGEEGFAVGDRLAGGEGAAAGGEVGATGGEVAAISVNSICLHSGY